MMRLNVAGDSLHTVQACAFGAQTSHNDTWKQARQIELRSRTSHNKQNFDAGMEQLVAFEEAG